MIIAADIGNTNIKIGLFDKDRLVKSWRIPRTCTAPPTSTAQS